MKKRILLSFLLSLMSLFVINAQKTTGLKFDANLDTSFVDCDTLGQVPSKFTVEVWAFVDDPSAGGYFLSNEGWDEALGNLGFSLRMNTGENPNVEFAAGASDGSWPSATAPIIPAKTWVHLAATYDSTNMILYVDGEPMDTTAVSAPLTYSTQHLILGEGSMWRGRRFTGRLSDFRFWNVVRTPDEISENKESYLADIPEGLIANWKLDEGMGDTIPDAVGNFKAAIGGGVSWYELAATEIAVSTPPTKVDYTTGDTLNLEGMEVIITYGQDSSKVVPFSDTTFADYFSITPAEGFDITENGTVTITHRLSTLTASQQYTFSPVSGILEQNRKSLVEVFQNKELNELKLVNKTNTLTDFQIIDITGKIILKNTLNRESIKNINTSNLKPGIYIITFKQNQNFDLQKIVIQ